MTIVEGQIEPLKKLKVSLVESGVTRFKSLGEIDRFLKGYESEKTRLRGQIEDAVKAEVRALRKSLSNHQDAYDFLVIEIRNEIEEKIHNLEVGAKRAGELSEKSFFYRLIYLPKLAYSLRRKTSLENNRERILSKKTSNAKTTMTKLKSEIEGYSDNRNGIVAARCKHALDGLAFTKKVIDEHYNLIAGAIGESSVVKALQQLPDDYYLINDFSIKLNPPIYNKREKDKIFSIQIDHLLICPAGVFLIETKNWSKSSVDNLDLRSPVDQVRRTSFALFVLLNSDSKHNDIEFEHHHWGAKKIPIRNIIVMTNSKPKEQFRHVKVLSLKDLIGYIQYFERVFSHEEVEGIFDALKKKI